MKSYCMSSKDSIMILCQIFEVLLYGKKECHTPYQAVRSRKEVVYQEKLLSDFHSGQYRQVRSSTATQWKSGTIS